ncbi:non-ribosomal peptide synthetase [Thalassomonas viridans]|uniref:Non-ribosomal peptide synthetase n=1 Tax=Thalassomonas viridans TaxID=137584 RepID=A0AAF0CDG9_9GAMM|nr:non-ribosomal peptide synthetase [Thalassomonas viridans]WDE09178.1 non-ribosomal peptide synthetase [Thalassomonas viridans]
MDIPGLQPLTLTQEDIYFDQLHHSASPLYNVGGYIRLGEIDIDKLTRAHQALVTQHDAFGLRIVSHEQGMGQYVSSERTLELPLTDFSQKPAPEQEAQAWLTTLFETAIETEDSELFRARLLKIAEDKYYYVGFAHHLTMDGWGFANWAQQLGHYYRDLCHDSGEKPWQAVVDKNTKYLGSKRYLKDQEFWRLQLKDLPDPVYAPGYFHRYSHLSSVPSSRKILPVSLDKHNALAEKAQVFDVPVAQLYLAIVAMYFSRANSVSDLVLGTPVHNRSDHAEKEMVGVFTSVSPIRLTIDREQTLEAFCRQIKSTMRQNFKHQRYPIGHMQRDVLTSGKERPLYEVGYNYLKLDSELTIEGKTADLVYLSHNHEQTPVMVTIWEYGEQQTVEIQLDHNLAYFSGQDAEMLAARLDSLLDQVIDGRHRLIRDFDMIPGGELQQLLAFSRGEPLDYAKDGPVHTLFEYQARRHPDKVALVFEQQSLTYAQLNGRANQIAHRLAASGSQKGDLIGIYMRRSVDTVASVLAILKLGGAYISLDPNYPRGRLEYLIQDSGIQVILTQQSLAPDFAGIANIYLDNDPELEAGPKENPAISYSAQQVAYVIYTSGSTGKPKGVVIRHSNVLALLHWAKASYDDEQLACVLASTSLNFDLSVFELFVPLCFGHRCLLVQDAMDLLAVKHPVSLINTVPSVAKALLSHQGIPDSVNTVNLAGEPLTSQVVNGLLNTGNCRKVCNLYGPSEDTTYSTYAEFTREISAVPDIGRVISNSQAWVLSPQQKLLPIGSVGELYLSGEGVASGYLNRPELTSEKFIKHELAEGPMYRTGDLVKYQSDGSLMFIGRVDEQVKLRGFRIELGEIEHQLMQQAGVKEAVVLVRQQLLVAYLVSGESDSGALQQALSLSLPEYMIPARFVYLEQFPLTPNGKVDKRALPEPDIEQDAGTFVAPVNDQEKQLAAIWGQVLSLPGDNISTRANFFALGGHSLSAVTVTAEIRRHFHVAITVKQFFDNATIGQLAHLIAQSDKAGVSGPVATAQDADFIPLSYSQQALWFIDNLNGGSKNYNMPLALEISGAFDPGAAEQALQAIIERHQILRSVYRKTDRGLEQSLLPGAEFVLEQLDLSGLPVAGQEARAQSLMEADAVKCFDLARDLMLRASWLAFTPAGAAQARGILLLNMHHIASDGWSMGILLKEFVSIYRAQVQGQAHALPSLAIQYADYALWQQSALQEEALAPQVDYWLKQLAQAPQRHSLPLLAPAKSGDKAGDAPAASYRQTISPALVERLRQTAQRHELTLFMLLHGALALLLSRHSNSRDIVIGTPVANRAHAEVQPLIGFFVNSLALRTGTGHKEIADYLAHIKQVNLEARDNQDLPFNKLVEHCRLPQESDYTPLFQIFFSMNEHSLAALALPQAKVRHLAPGVSQKKFELEIEAQLIDGQLSINWTYDTGLFDSAWIGTLSQHFERLLSSFTLPSLSRMDELEMLSEQERRYLLETLNDNARDYSKAMPLHQLFEQQVKSKPEHEVLSFDGRALSYQELNQRANRIARYLVSLGAQPGDMLGVAVRRGIDMVAAILAVLKAGCAYVPLDPNYPKARRQHIIADSRIKVLLTQDEFAGEFEVEQLVSLDDKQVFAGFDRENLEIAVDSRALAYAIYTSGSTGLPKGVAIRHCNAAAMLHWANGRYRADELERILASTSLNFDLSIFELFLPLCFGHHCVLVENALTLLEQEVDVSLINTVPSAIASLIGRQAIPASVKVVNLAGEPLTTETVNKLLALGVPKVCNLYGPSEDTTYSTYAEFTSPIGRIPEIGKVIDNSQAYVLSEQGALLPYGATGELYLGGDGVAQGYIRREELTARLFVDNPFGDGVLYRTGDLVRYLDGGKLGYIGRIDEQVKIRGFRIELGEIEQALLHCPGVEKAVVLASGQGQNKQLLAFVASGQAEEKAQQDFIQACKQQLGELLPEYMVPPAFVLLRELPLTPNGKIDKKALQALEPQVSAREYQAPQTPTEIALAAIWAARLAIKEGDIGLTDNFFTLGGHSLLAVSLSADIEKRLQCSLSLKDIFDHAGLGQMARRIDALGPGSVPAVIEKQPRDSRHYPLSFAQKRLWFLAQLETAGQEYNMPASLEVKGVFDPDLAQAAIRQIIDRHETLRSRFILVDEEPRQTIAEDRDFCLVTEDLTGFAPKERRQRLAALTRANEEHRFDLAAERLLTVHYVLLEKTAAGQQGMLLFNMHHIISDAWSLGILVQEFVACYQALSQQTQAQLSELQIQYLDYIGWQQAVMTEQALAPAMAYWKNLLADAPASHSLPMDRGRGQQESRGGIYRQLIPAAQKNKIRAQLEQTGTSLFMWLQASFALHLGRLSHEYDVVLGAPVAGRNNHQVEPLIGLFLNTQVFRTEFADDPSFIALLERTREQHLSSAQYNEVPFESIVEQLNPERDLNRSPLFQILINFNNTRQADLALDECRFIPVEAQQAANKYDITLYIEENSLGEINLCWAYNAGLFDAKTIAMYAGEYRHLIGRLLEQPELPVLQHGWQSAGKWQEMAAIKPSGKPYQFMAGFEARVSESPQAPALSYGDVCLTYKQLDEKVNRLGHYLARQGVTSDSRVAIATTRNELRIIAILAVLKLGACYVPLSEELPAGRLQYMLQSSGAKFLLSDSQSREEYRLITDSSEADKIRTLILDKDECITGVASQEKNLTAVNVRADSEAHIIFTSGSTGLPKAVSGSYGATDNRIRWMLEVFPFAPGEAVAHITSMAFIRGVWELLVPLCGGAHLVLCPRDKVKDTQQLWDFLLEQQISRLVTAPSLMKALGDLGAGSGKVLPLRYWFVSGEPLLQAYANEILAAFPQTQLYNLYGSTEVMSDVLYKKVTAGSKRVWVPAGKAIANTRAVVLGENASPVPDNVIGEIAILGLSLSNGYLPGKGQKNDAFIETPLGRAYKTGDLGLRQEDGDIYCLGRVDDQVKIRGYRVEPGEVVRQLSSVSAVKACYVAVAEVNGRQSLVAYIAPHDWRGESDGVLLEEVKGVAVRVLPGYMRPAFYVLLEQMPLRANGKVDRQALPEPGPQVSGETVIGAATASEQQVAAIWAQLLNMDENLIDVTTSFFDLGGHSLLVTQLFKRLEASFGLVLSYQEFFTSSTVRYVAQRIDSARLVKDILVQENAGKSKKNNKITI